MKIDSSPRSREATNAAQDRIDELPLPYIEIDASGIVTHANRATRELHPDDQGELIGRPAWDSEPTAEKAQNYAAYRSLMETGVEPPVARRNLYDSSGSFRTYQLYRNLMRNPDGRPVGMRMVCVDVTETSKELEEARRSRKWLESVIAALSDAVVVTDALGYIRTVNPAAETLFGWKAAEMIGQLVEDKLRLTAYSSADVIWLNHCDALEKSTKGIGTMLDNQRRELHLEIGTSPVLNQENGFTEGVVTVLRRLKEAV
jgi:PAS domain S-box-containing protein